MNISRPRGVRLRAARQVEVRAAERLYPAMRSLALALLVAHIVAGTAAVVVGLVALVARKPVERRAPRRAC